MMDKLIATEKYVVATPFPTREVKMAVSRGFGGPQQRTELTELEVLAHSEAGYSPGDKIFVSGDDMKMAYAGQILTMGEVQYILVPAERVVLHLPVFNQA